MLVNSSSIKNKEEDSIDGTARNRTSMKVNLRLEKETAEEPSGGLMAAGMKASSRREFNVGLEPYTAKVATSSTRASGRMECSTARASNTSTTVRDTRVISSRTSSTARGYFIKTTRSFMGFGKTTSYLS